MIKIYLNKVCYRRLKTDRHTCWVSVQVCVLWGTLWSLKASPSETLLTSAAFGAFPGCITRCTRKWRSTPRDVTIFSLSFFLLFWAHKESWDMWGRIVVVHPPETGRRRSLWRSLQPSDWDRLHATLWCNCASEGCRPELRHSNCLNVSLRTKRKKLLKQKNESLNPAALQSSHKTRVKVNEERTAVRSLKCCFGGKHSNIDDWKRLLVDFLFVGLMEILPLNVSVETEASADNWCVFGRVVWRESFAVCHIQDGFLLLRCEFVS